MPGTGGCYAEVAGYRFGYGRMEIGLNQNTCMDIKYVLQNLLRALGFMYEHNRPDRDDYITINWQNINVGLPSISKHFL